jgi:hypothetical protein
VKVILCSKGERVGGLEGRECEEERGRRARGFCRDDPSAIASSMRLVGDTPGRRGERATQDGRECNLEGGGAEGVS